MRFHSRVSSLIWLVAKRWIISKIASKIFPKINIQLLCIKRLPIFVWYICKLMNIVQLFNKNGAKPLPLWLIELNQSNSFFIVATVLLWSLEIGVDTSDIKLCYRPLKFYTWQTLYIYIYIHIYTGIENVDDYIYGVFMAAHFCISIWDK